MNAKNLNDSRHGLIPAILQSGRRAVVAVTGGGSLAVSDLLTVPGASAFVLEAIVPYSPFALLFALLALFATLACIVNIFRPAPRAGADSVETAA